MSIRIGDIDSTQHGVVGDGVTDCAAALQALIDSCQGQTIALPFGSVLISKTLDFASQNRIGLRGAGCSSVGGAGTRLVGNVAGPLVFRDVQDHPCSAFISDVGFINGNAGGCGIGLEYVTGAALERLTFQGGGGLVIGKRQPTNVDIAIRDCFFIGSLAKWPNAVACALRGQGNLDNVSCYQWATGLQLANKWNISGGHFEVNQRAVALGLNPDGSSRDCHGDLSGLSFEANLTALTLLNGSNPVVNDCTILGEFQNVPGQSDVGLDLQVRRGNFKNLGIGGTFRTAGVRMVSGGEAIFDGELVQNQMGPAWLVVNPAGQKVLESKDEKIKGFWQLML